MLELLNQLWNMIDLNKSKDEVKEKLDEIIKKQWELDLKSALDCTRSRHDRQRNR